MVKIKDLPKVERPREKLVEPPTNRREPKEILREIEEGERKIVNILKKISGDITR